MSLGGAEPFQGYTNHHYLIPGLPKLNSGLQLANTFGVVVSATRKWSLLARSLDASTCDAHTGELQRKHYRSILTCRTHRDLGTLLSGHSR